MSWDRVWERIFVSRGWRRYPDEDLVRFVAAHYLDVPDPGLVRILELGCGPGANVWFLAREGYDVHGVDGSPEAIEQARRRLASEDLSAGLHVADLTGVASLYPPEHFDAIADVQSIQHNSRQAAESIVAAAERLLRPGGRIFSAMLAAGSTGQGTGVEIEPGTETGIREGRLAETGLCRFSTLDDVTSLFGRFTIEDVRYLERGTAAGDERYRHWLVWGRKPE